jgi:hypothetical protein
MRPFAFVFIALFPVLAHAQAFGGDNVTMELNHSGQFMPHLNDCDSSTEVFLNSGSASNKGFCIEKNERSALAWEDARQTCVSLGKRLPEPAEWKIACKAAPAGLSDMTGNWEWASNFQTGLTDSTNHNYIVSVVVGYTNCATGNYGIVMADTGSGEGSYVYRCAR